jgi:hypothetical protein
VVNYVRIFQEVKVMSMLRQMGLHQGLKNLVPDLGPASRDPEVLQATARWLVVLFRRMIVVQATEEAQVLPQQVTDYLSSEQFYRDVLAELQ